MTLVADLDCLVVLNILIPVTLGMDEDLFLTGAVLDAQFVGAVAARTAQGLEHAAGLVGGQRVGRGVFGVVQATADQRLVGITFQKGHQHFHADPGDAQAAVTVTGPTGRHAQPATALLVGLAFAVPVKLHPDPAMPVAVNLFACRARDDSRLAAGNARFGMGQGRTVGDVAGDGPERVAVTLTELACVRRRGGRCLFQHLRLTALMPDLGQQP
ncbi:hypothetical protein PSFL111601_28300 [Pseudomonas floridensis]